MDNNFDPQQSPHVKRFLDIYTSPYGTYPRWEMEHPTYDYEEEWTAIYQIWIEHRDRYQREHGKAVHGPVRKMGRPKTWAGEQEKIAKAKAATEAKQVERQQRARQRSLKKEERYPITIKLQPEVLAAIIKVKGDLTTEECIRQLIGIALGPLASPQVGAVAKDHDVA